MKINYKEREEKGWFHRDGGVLTIATDITPCPLRDICKYTIATDVGLNNKSYNIPRFNININRVNVAL